MLGRSTVKSLLLAAVEALEREDTRRAKLALCCLLASALTPVELARHERSTSTYQRLRALAGRRPEASDEDPGEFEHCVAVAPAVRRHEA